MRLRVPTLVMTAAAVLAVLPATLPATAVASAPAPVRDGRPAVAAPGGEGGRPVYAKGGVRCVIGFNVRRSGAHHFLTAGGCARTGLTLYADPGLTVEVGTVVAVTNVATALVRYVEPGVERPGSVYLYPGSQDITAAGSPVVGQRVCRSGPTTGVRCGTVTGVNLTISFPEGTVSGVARTNICAEPGDDPGAPYFSGTTAIGLGLGGGACAGGGSSYFQPVTGVLSAFGAEVY